MWPRGWDLTQAVFFLNRYGISACLIYVNYSEWPRHFDLFPINFPNNTQLILFAVVLAGMRSPLNEKVSPSPLYIPVTF